MFEYCNNILCVQPQRLIDSGYITRGQYVYWKSVKQLCVVRKACNNTPALVAYDSLPEDIKARIKADGYDPHREAMRNLLEPYITPDSDAAHYYATYLTPAGTKLKEAHQLQYTTEAIILNAIRNYLSDIVGNKRVRGGRLSGIWQAIARAVQELDPERFRHSLPENPRRLHEKYRQYIHQGYAALVHGGFGNKNRAKTNELIERLIISIYCMDNLPFGEWVHEYYLKFIAGSLQIVDAETGELFDREQFRDNKGNYIIISRSTVWNILHKPENAIIIDRQRKARIDHITGATPFNRRRKPDYSLSMVTLDDWQHNIRTTEGEKLNIYSAFDVASEAMIGWAYATHTPDTAMIYDCLRSMYYNLQAAGLPWPIEAQVEHHLIRDMDATFGSIFTHLTYCTPGVSRDKHAENFIRQLKYTVMKRYQPMGRWWARSEAYRTKNIAKDEELKQPRMPKDELIANLLSDIAEYNHSLHSNQKKYPGKTRWQVLMENVNPKALPIATIEYRLLRHIGNCTDTSIRNNDYVKLQYDDYYLESFDMLRHLKPGNYNVQAYWLPDASGKITTAYIYQDDTYLGRVMPYERYNSAKAERTEEDERIRVDQAKRQRVFFKNEKNLKTNKFQKIALAISHADTQYDDLVAKPIDMPEPALITDEDLLTETDITNKAINSL